MTWHLTRVRRDALPAGVDAMLRSARVGQRIHFTIWGVEHDAIITELSGTWVEVSKETVE